MPALGVLMERIHGIGEIEGKTDICPFLDSGKPRYGNRNNA